MSDVGRLRRFDNSRFPSVRKSSDPFNPEMGEMDFSQDIEEFDSMYSTAVLESEKTEQPVIRDENRRRQYRYRKRQQKQNETKNATEPEERFVDLQA